MPEKKKLLEVKDLKVVFGSGKRRLPPSTA